MYRHDSADRDRGRVPGRDAAGGGSTIGGAIRGSRCNSIHVLSTIGAGQRKSGSDDSHGRKRDGCNSNKY